MEKILLIHGYGIGINSPFQRDKLENSSFYEAFKHKHKKNLYFYNWTVCFDKLKLWEASNPFVQINIYKQEQSFINDINNQKKLANYIRTNNITKVVAHSMGANFVLQTINNHCVESLKTIFVLQGDCDINLNHLDSKLNHQINIINYYNPFDYSLLTSILINGKLRAGNFGFKTENYKRILLTNIFYIPTFTEIDIHLDILKNKKLWNILLG